MARKRGGGNASLAIALFVIVALAAGGWFALHRAPARQPIVRTPAAASPAAADRVDPANEGHSITLDGTLRVAKPARDPQLGIEADAVALLRQVEMRQWRETCSANGCAYALEWSAKPIDSRSFREAAGHQNPARFPFASERFLAGELRLGAFIVDPALAVDGAEAVAYPVRAAQLPPNLAASFREHDGVLYAGAGSDQGAADHGAAGDLRVSYRIVAAGLRRLSGVQQGSRLAKAGFTH